MSKRSLLTAVGVSAILALLVAQPASAATEAGNGCEGNEVAEGFTVYGVANAPGSPLPATIPASGVVTRWTFKVVPEVPPGLYTQTLKIFRPTGVFGQFQAIGDSSPGSVVGGLNTFPTRIPVQAGDFLGLTGTVVFLPGEPFTIYCSTPNPGDRFGAFVGNPPVGTTALSVGEEGGAQIPVTVAIEPDADGDGYGDETQDACPQSAAFQTACPVVVLDSFALPGKGRAVVLVTTSIETPVTVSAFAKLPKTKKARASATIKLRKVKRTVKQGQIKRFVLKFPGRLKRALKALPKRRKLRLKITASARNVAGQASKDKTTLKLKGAS